MSNNISLEEHKKNILAYINRQINTTYISNKTELDKYKRNYFSNFVSMLLLEHHRLYKNTKIHSEGRFKSDKSYIKKIEEIVLTEDDYSRPITDLFAAKIIIENTKEILPKNSQLYLERKKNLQILNELNEYLNENFSFSGDTIKPILASDYYNNLLKLIETIKTTIPKEATQLVKLYDDKIKVIKQRKEFLSIRKNQNATNNDLHIDDKAFDDTAKGKTDFESLLEDFDARIDDNMHHQILINQLKSVFENSEYLKKFKAYIKKEKSKITQTGYVSTFLIIESPAAKFELQLQTAHQAREGNIGYLASHSNYKTLSAPPEIPDFSNTAKVKQFKQSLKFITPEYFKATLNEYVITPEVNIFMKNYLDALKELYQVPANNHLREEIDEYLNLLKENENKLTLKSNLFSEDYTMDKIDKYLSSDEFKKLQILAKKQKEKYDKTEK